MWWPLSGPRSTGEANRVTLHLMLCPPYTSWAPLSSATFAVILCPAGSICSSSSQDCLRPVGATLWQKQRVRGTSHKAGSPSLSAMGVWKLSPPALDQENVGLYRNTPLFSCGLGWHFTLFFGTLSLLDSCLASSSPHFCSPPSYWCPLGSKHSPNKSVAHKSSSQDPTKFNQRPPTFTVS